MGDDVDEMMEKERDLHNNSIKVTAIVPQILCVTIMTSRRWYRWRDTVMTTGRGWPESAEVSEGPPCENSGAVGEPTMRHSGHPRIQFTHDWGFGFRVVHIIVFA